MTISGIIVGIVLILYGLFLLVEIFQESVVWAIIVGGGMIVIGFFIIFNRKEDKIEQIKK